MIDRRLIIIYSDCRPWSGARISTRRGRVLLRARVQNVIFKTQKEKKFHRLKGDVISRRQNTVANLSYFKAL